MILRILTVDGGEVLEKLKTSDQALFKSRNIISNCRRNLHDLEIFIACKFEFST